MAYFRATAIVLAMLLFLSLVPLQWLALRRRWPRRLWLPLAFGRTVAVLLRLRIFVKHVPPPQEPRLIAANHVSWLDILALCSVEPVCFLAKQEVDAWPVASTLARLQETLLVARPWRGRRPPAQPGHA